MLAVEKGLTHLSVANAIAKKNPNVVVLKLDSGLTVSNWAQEKGHDAFFKVCHFSTSTIYIFVIILFMLTV